MQSVHLSYECLSYVVCFNLLKRDKGDCLAKSVLNYHKVDAA
jgi:hypothetical protein